MGQGQGGSATTTQTLNVIPAQERRANGLASRGPRSSLTPELALEIAGLLESGGVNQRDCRENRPPSVNGPALGEVGPGGGFGERSNKIELTHKECTVQLL